MKVLEIFYLFIFLMKFLFLNNCYVMKFIEDYWIDRVIYIYIYIELVCRECIGYFYYYFVNKFRLFKFEIC